jgi:hypothetical protein
MRSPETAGFAVNSLEMYALVCKSVGCSNKAKASSHANTQLRAFTDEIVSGIVARALEASQLISKKILRKVYVTLDYT